MPNTMICCFDVPQTIGVFEIDINLSKEIIKVVALWCLVVIEANLH